MGYQASIKGMPACIHRMLIIQSIEIQSETHRVIISIAAGAEGEICGKFHKNVLACLLFPFEINVNKSKRLGDARQSWRCDGPNVGGWRTDLAC